MEEGASAVLDGTVDDVDTAVLGVVRATESGTPDALCTGVLVLPNLVLTARHCVAMHGGTVDCATATFGETYDASRMRISTDTVLDVDLTDYRRARAIYTLDDPRDCGFDQALIELEENVPSDVATPREPRIDEPTVAGETFTAIGYGLSGPGAGDSGTRRRRSDLTVRCVGADCADDFIAETEWSADVGHCSGDSGAPALDGEGRVIGIVARGVGACTTPILGQVATFRDFIREHAAIASEHGGYDLPAWARPGTGAGGAGGSGTTGSSVDASAGAGGAPLDAAGGAGGIAPETVRDATDDGGDGCGVAATAPRSRMVPALLGLALASALARRRNAGASAARRAPED